MEIAQAVFSIVVVCPVNWSADWAQKDWGIPDRGYHREQRCKRDRKHLNKVDCPAAGSEARHDGHRLPTHAEEGEF